jgi:hypothetical protein
VLDEAVAATEESLFDWELHVEYKTKVGHALSLTIVSGFEGRERS